MNSRFSSLALVKNVLRKSFAATRSNQDLEIIYDYVTKYTEIEHDHLWKLLSKPQRLQLCSYFRHYCVESKTSIHLNDVYKGSKLLIFVKGEAQIRCGNHSIQLHSYLGVCLGEIPLPAYYNKILDRKQKELKKDGGSSGEKNNYQQFLEQTSKDNEISNESESIYVLVQHRSDFIYLDFQDAQMFLERFYDRKVSFNVLKKFRCHTLLKPNLQFITFPQGHPIVLEGKSNDKILLTIRGKCVLKVKSTMKSFINENHPVTNNESSKAVDETIDICEICPLSFLAFQPHFIDGVNSHIVSAFAGTKVQILVLDAKEFKKCIYTCQPIKTAFEELARQQTQWLKTGLPEFIKKKRNQHRKIENDAILVEGYPNATVSGIEDLIRVRTRKNPRTNKCKVLHEFKKLVNGTAECDGDASQSSEDLFLRFAFETVDVEQSHSNDDPKISALLPFPSILLSRRRHGKTLPNVALSDGYLNPFDDMQS